MNKQSQHGFTLVEVLVTIGIISILGAVTASLMEFSVKGNSMQRFSIQTNNYDAETRAILSSPVGCAKSFSGVDLTKATTEAIPITQIVDEKGKVMSVLNTPYGDRSFILTSMTLSDYVETTDPGGRIVLTMIYNSTVDTLGPKVFTRLINLETIKGPAGRLMKCVALAKMSDGIWQYVPNTAYDAFFTGGNIGIGTATPRQTLQVNGKIQGRLDCREIEVRGGPPNYISVATCDKGEYLLEGGGYCSNLGSNGIGNPGEIGFLHASYKMTGQESWMADCFDPVHNIDVASAAHAVCCNDGT